MIFQCCLSLAPEGIFSGESMSIKGGLVMEGVAAWAVTGGEAQGRRRSFQIISKKLNEKFKIFANLKTKFRELFHFFMFYRGFGEICGNNLR